MADYTLLLEFAANVSPLQAAMATASSTVMNYGRRVSQVGRSVSSEMRNTLLNSDWVEKHEQDLNRVGGAALGFGAATLAGLGMAARAAMDWESAWAGVLKTTDADESFLPQLESDLRALTEVLPATHEEIAGVAEMAGQLGVSAEDVVGFTKVMIDLGEATNLTSEEAATSLAQFMNIMGTASEDVGRLGAALVELGNNSATTEADIVRMAMRIAGAGSTIGMTEADVLALATAMSSVGINAEAGGSSISRSMIMIAGAVNEGGESLQEFADVAGVSADTFATAFRERPAEAMTMFIQGLNDVQTSGGDLFGLLDDLGFKSVQMRDTMLRLGGAAELMAEMVDMGSEAWEANTALVEEAGNRYATTESQLAMARNAFRETAIEIGDSLLPMLQGAADTLQTFLGWVQSIPEPIMNLVTQLGLIAGAAAVAAGGLLLLIPRIHQTRVAAQRLASQMPRTNRAIRGLGRAGAIGVAIAGVAALGEAFDTTTKKASNFNGAVEELASGNLTTDDLVDRFLNLSDTMRLTLDVGREHFGSLSDIIIMAANESGSAVDDFGASLAGLVEGLGVSMPESDWDTLAHDFGAFGEELAAVAREDAPLAREAFRNLWMEWGATDEAAQALLKVMPAYEQELRRQAEAAELALTDSELLLMATGNLSTAQFDAADAAKVQEAALADAAAAAGMTTEAYEEAAEKYLDLIEAYAEASASFIDIGGTYLDMLDRQIEKQAEAAGFTEDGKAREGAAWDEFVDGVRVNVDEYLAELERQVEAQRNWQANILDLAGKVSQGSLDYLSSLGEEGAPLVQALTEMTAEELAKWDSLTQQSLAGASMNWADTVQRARPLLEAAAAHYGEGFTDSLEQAILDGSVSVEDAAAALGWRLVELAPGEFVIDFQGNPDGALEAVEAIIESARNEEGVVELDADDTAAIATILDAVQFARDQDGEIVLGADPTPGLAMLNDLVLQADTATGEITINGNATPGETTLGDLLGDINEADGTVTLNGNAVPATTTLNDLVEAMNTATGTATIAGQDSPARDTLAAFLAFVGTQHAQAILDANDGDAQAVVDEFIRRNSQRRVAIEIATYGQGAVATGGDVTAIARAVRGYQHGGAVWGPGTGTSDDVPAVGPFGVPFRLSNGEHVLTAAEVEALGGQARVYALRSMIRQGSLQAALGFRDGGEIRPIPLRPTAAYAFPAAGVAGVQQYVTVNAVPVDRANETAREVLWALRNLQRSGFSGGSIT